MTNTTDAVRLGAFFTLEIEGMTITAFTGISGLSIEFDVAAQPQSLATGKIINKKVPGSRPKYAEISLKRGLSENKDLQDWFNQIVEGKEPTPYKTGSIVIRDSAGTEIARFNFERMWPSKLSAGDLDAGNSSLLVEECTIQHDHLEWKT
jgi:phage tail-like protein